MTNTQLKNQINTNITNETQNYAITNVDVGENMKDIVDYIDQEISTLPTVITKTVHTVITEAQILQLFTTPISILNSEISDSIKIPTSIVCKRKSNTGTAYTCASNQFKLSDSTGNTFTMTFFNTPLTSINGSSFTVLNINGLNVTTDFLENTQYYLGAYTSNPTGGTGDFDIYVTYNEIILQ